jgi:hypothetical protein
MTQENDAAAAVIGLTAKQWGLESPHDQPRTPPALPALPRILPRQRRIPVSRPPRVPCARYTPPPA